MWVLKVELDVQVRNVKELRSIIDELKEKFHNIIQDYEVLHYTK